MMSLQPNQPYFKPQIVSLNAIARKASVEEDADLPEASTDVEADFDDELAELEKEDKLQAAIKAKRETKKKAEKAKQAAVAKKNRNAVLKKIAIGIGVTAGAVVTAGAGLAGYWYFHNHKPPITGDEMIKYASELATMSQYKKNDLVNKFRHLEVGFNSTQGGFINGIKTKITNYDRACRMAPEHKAQVVKYLFTQGGLMDYFSGHPTKFNDSMANITGEIFSTKGKQKNASLFSALSHNLEMTQEMAQSRAQREGRLTTNEDRKWDFAYAVRGEDGNLLVRGEDFPLSSSELNAVNGYSRIRLDEVKALTNNNTQGLMIEDYVPALHTAITETLNPYLTKKGLKPIDINSITAKAIADQKLELGSGTVAKTFRIVAEDGTSYAAKVVHPAISKETFPAILEREIIRLQMQAEKVGDKPLSYADAVLIAVEKLGALTQETDLAVEHLVHQKRYEDFKAGRSAVNIHEAIALHNTSGAQVAFQELIEGLTTIGDSQDKIDVKAKARIKVFMDNLCEIFNGNMHADLHIGNTGFDNAGNVFKIDFGRSVVLQGDTPKHVRALMIELLINDGDKNAILKALETLNGDTFKRLSPKQKGDLVTKLKDSPFHAVEKLFQYRFFDQPANTPEALKHINVNYSSLADRGKINVTHRIDAGLATHTEYRSTAPSSDSFPLLGKKLVRKPTYDQGELVESSTDYTQTYVESMEPVLTSLLQDRPDL